MYDAVIFDMDGLLLDTEALFIQAARTAYGNQGVHDIDAFMHWCVGVDTATCRAEARTRFGAQLDMDRIDRDQSAEWLRLTGTHIPHKPDVSHVLDHLAAQNIPRAIATSSGFDDGHRKARVAGLDRWFDTIVTVDCVARAKPAPDPYLEAARRLNVDPTRCVAFEDSDPGTRAALAAGMTVVQVPDILPSGVAEVHFTARTLSEGFTKAKLW